MFGRGETPTVVRHLRSGVVSSSWTDLQGREQLWSLRGPGAMVGWRALAQRPSDVDAVVYTEGEACSIDVATLRAWMEENGAVACAVTDCLLAELESIACQRRLQAESTTVRVARFLLGEVSCVSTELDGSTARSVARQLGMRHETFSRILARFAEDGLISHPRRPKVNNRAGLRRVVQNGS